jgi:hypothetical protein
MDGGEPAAKRPKPDEEWRLEKTLSTAAAPDDEAQHAFAMVRGAERHSIGPSTDGIRLLKDGAVSWHPRKLREWLRASTKLRTGDVVVACYPKCGTTLTEQLVLLALNGGDAASLDPLSKNARNFSKRALGKVWPEACLRPDNQQVQVGQGKEEFVPMTLGEFNKLPEPRVIKTHARVPHLLGGNGLVKGAKYVVCTRNPFDACVSAYYHAWHPQNNGWPFDAWVHAWLASDAWAPHGSWFRWHTEWRNAASSESVLWLWYEDVVNVDSQEYWARTIATFVLGEDPSDELVQKMVAGASFAAMKAQALQAEGPSRLNSSEHLRVGKAGTWRDHFAPYPGLEEEVRKVFKARMAGPGLAWNVGEGEAIVTPITLPDGPSR